ELSSPAELGRTRVSQAAPLQPAAQRRALCRVGAAGDIRGRAARRFQVASYDIGSKRGDADPGPSEQHHGTDAIRRDRCRDVRVPPLWSRISAATPLLAALHRQARLLGSQQDREPLSGPNVPAAQLTAFRAWERGDGGERFAKLRRITQPRLVVTGC